MRRDAGRMGMDLITYVIGIPLLLGLICLGAVEFGRLFPPRELK